MTPNVVSKLKETRKQSNHHQHKLAATVMLQGRPLAFAFNDRDRSHPTIRNYHPHKTIHAEISACYKVKNRDLLKRCTLVVYREDRYGNMALAKPCPVCTEMLKDLGIRKVIYSDASGWIEEKI